MFNIFNYKNYLIIILPILTLQPSLINKRGLITLPSDKDNVNGDN